MAETGEIKDYKIAPALVENVHCLTYGQADSLILFGQEKYARATAQYLPLHQQGEQQQLLAAPDAAEREERKVRVCYGPVDKRGHLADLAPFPERHQGEPAPPGTQPQAEEEAGISTAAQRAH
jgi:hypothetical protein